MTYRVTLTLFDPTSEEFRGEETHEVSAGCPEFAVGTALFVARHTAINPPPIEHYHPARVEEVDETDAGR